MKRKEVKEEVIEQPSKTREETTQNEVVLSVHDHKMLDNDIKFRGPLSYRYLRLIGWIMMAVMFVSIILGLVIKIRTALGDTASGAVASLEKAGNVLSYFSALPLPLFLIANFAVILQEKGNYKKLIFKYVKILLMVYVGFIFVYYHYVVILMMRLGEMSFGQARQESINYFSMIGKQNGLVVNVFVDLFCCVLIMFFIDYTPKKLFQGKKIIIFRLLALLPILYEVGSAVMMGLLNLNAIYADFTFALPPEILPLIGKKPIGMIIAFTVICIYVKIREKIYLKRGGTPEGYKLYVETNRNSFRFSLMMSITFFVIAVIDLIAFLVPVLNIIGNNSDPTYQEAIMNAFTGFTIGKSACLLLVIPFTLLFSYTKKHENSKLDKLLPIIGIGLVLFTIIETLFFVIIS